jgi:hypothetical protein
VSLGNGLDSGSDFGSGGGDFCLGGDDFGSDCCSRDGSVTGWEKERGNLWSWLL